MDAESEMGKAGIADKCWAPITAVGNIGGRSHISGEVHIKLEWRSLNIVNVQTMDMLGQCRSQILDDDNPPTKILVIFSNNKYNNIK